MPTVTDGPPTPSQKTSGLATDAEAGAKAAEFFISRIHVNGWVLLGAVIAANVLGILTHW